MRKLTVLIFALAMVATACMTDETTITATSATDLSGSAESELVADDAPADQAFVDDGDDSSGDASMSGNATVETDAPAEQQEIEPEASAPAPVANGPGIGSLPADVCDNGQVIHGLITIDDLVAAGLPYEAGSTITYNGPDALDGGIACNVFVSSGGGFNVLMDEVDAEAAQEARDDATEVTQVGEVQVTSRINEMAILTSSEIQWPHGDGFVTFGLHVNSTTDEGVRQALHQVSTRIAEGAVLEPTGAQTPDWWVCDDANFASAGGSVAEIAATMAGGIDPAYSGSVSGSLIAYEECYVGDEEAGGFFRADTQVEATLYPGDLDAANDDIMLAMIMTDTLQDDELTIGGFPGRIVSFSDFDTHRAIALVDVEGDALLVDAYRAMPDGDYESGTAWVLSLAEAIVAGR